MCLPQRISYIGLQLTSFPSLHTALFACSTKSVELFSALFVLQATKAVWRPGNEARLRYRQALPCTHHDDPRHEGQRDGDVHLDFPTRRVLPSVLHDEAVNGLFVGDVTSAVETLHQAVAVKDPLNGIAYHQLNYSKGACLVEGRGQGGGRRGGGRRKTRRGEEEKGGVGGGEGEGE